MEQNVTGNSINIMVIGMSNVKLNNLFFSIVALPSVPSHIGHIVLLSKFHVLCIFIVFKHETKSMMPVILKD
jgi:hypothetical protein